MTDPLTQEEVIQQVWKDFVKSRDPHLREKLILQYTPLVKYVMKLRNVRHSPFFDSSDLISSGTIGLIEAVDRFDPERGVTFQTYAIRRIRGAIIDETRRLDPLKRSGRAKLKKIQNAEGALAQQLGREPTDREVAQFLDMPLEKYRRDKTQVSRMEVSLGVGDPDSHRFEELPPSLENIIPDPNIEDTALVVERSETHEKLRAAIRELPKREQTIILFSYQEGLNLSQIASRLNVSESLICKLRARALRLLRQSLEEAHVVV